MTLTGSQARVIADAALAAATGNGLQVSVSVVDHLGRQLFTQLGDGAMWFTAGMAHTKARTAAVTGQDSAQYGVLSAKYPEVHVEITRQLGFAPTGLTGGVPIFVEGKLIGAIGVSGATGDQDETCARTGADVMR